MDRHGAQRPVDHGPKRAAIEVGAGGAAPVHVTGMTRFSRRFNVFVASGAAVYLLGALFGRATYVLTAAVLFAYAAREWARCRGDLRGLAVDVRTQGPWPAGVPVPVDLVLRAERAYACVEAAVELGRADGEGDAGVLVDEVTPGEERCERLELDPLPRGVHRLETLAVAVHGELGLIRRSEDRPLARELAIYPRPRAPRTVVPPPLEPAETLGVLPGPLAPTGPVHLRAFAAGDSGRRIHWRATARLGQLVVLTTRVGPQARVLLVVDDAAGPELETVLAVGAWALERPGDGRRRVLALASDGPDGVTFDEADPLASGRERLARAQGAPGAVLTRFLTRLPRTMPECEVCVICASLPHVPSLEGYPIGFLVSGKAARSAAC